MIETYRRKAMRNSPYLPAGHLSRPESQLQCVALCSPERILSCKYGPSCSDSIHCVWRAKAVMARFHADSSEDEDTEDMALIGAAIPSDQTGSFQNVGGLEPQFHWKSTLHFHLAGNGPLPQTECVDARALCNNFPLLTSGDLFIDICIHDIQTLLN